VTNLQIRIAGIMIVAIVTVVAIATGVTLTVIRSGGDKFVHAYAQQVLAITELVQKQTDGGPLTAFGALRPSPASGEPEPQTTRLLMEAVGAAAPDFHPIVTRNPGTDDYAVSIPIKDRGWLVLPIVLLPSDAWTILGGWLLMVVVGVSAIAFVVAQRVTRPFVVMEQAIASVSADGVLPAIPEVGARETRDTAAALNRLSGRLRSAMESRMRLVAAAGHDLRTPMTRMQLRAEFLPDDERAAWLHDLEELDLIADSAIRLVREEAAGSDRNAIRLDLLVEETVVELKEAKLRVSLESSDDVSVTAGPLALKRALRNLIINAATHGGGASVRLGVTDTAARLIIEDDGPGIPADIIDRVFEPFFRVDPGRRQSAPGAGLGLAIAREIVERFGGKIEIANRPEGGLRQTVFLPLAAS
jgi:signal transduction histidine kinase